MSREILSTKQKALDVNLDSRRYGTFAEIGAGQEVVRWFFRVGGAAGTIAKSMSAYDMAVSDAIYGNCSRYVSRERLEDMLSHEHNLNLERLKQSRGDTTSFFAFADTVSARNFKGTNKCHGWMGIRFQAYPRDEDSQILIHVRMLDDNNLSQQEALGIVGVNLLYGAFFLHHEPDQLVESLLDNLDTDRIEIDMIEFSGISFRHVDNRIMSLRLVQLGLSNSAMFGPDGTVLQPSEALYKKSILVERGSFRPPTKVNIDLMNSAKERFAKDIDSSSENIVSIAEITMNNLCSEGQVDLSDFVARADLLSACGFTVMISNYFQFYRLAEYLSQNTNGSIAIAIGAANLQKLFEEEYYTDLDGGILESFGRLFKNDLKLLVYPYRDFDTNELVTISNLKVNPRIQKLYDFLTEQNSIEQLQNFNSDLMHIYSRETLKRIGTGQPGWENDLPPEVTELIKQKGYFGYQPVAPVLNAQAASPDHAIPSTPLAPLTP